MQRVSLGIGHTVATSGWSCKLLPTRLEQGQSSNPSADVVAALTRAMRLPRMELELLHQLAGHSAPHDLDVPRHLSPGMVRLLDRVGDIQVASYDATWTLMSCTRLGAGRAELERAYLATTWSSLSSPCGCASGGGGGVPGPPTTLPSRGPAHRHCPLPR